ncbi:MAG: serine dehydrogenasease [Pseudomonadota bacterium]
MQMSSDGVVRKQLDTALKKIEDILDGSALVFVGPLRFGIDDVLRDVERRMKNKRERLIVILETPGGFAEVTQRIADKVFRNNFSIVDFVVPNHAMSAGTILVMSGDAIYMDDYSNLGPIDPQVENFRGQMVPASGYLRQYDGLLQKATAGTITPAEVQILVDGFDQAELYKYKQAEQLSVKLLTDWLVQYKFKDWQTTETRKLPVTPQMRADRASEIAQKLGNPDLWFSHGRGITLKDLQSELNLVIDDFSQNVALNTAITEYNGLLHDYMAVKSLTSAAHVRGHFRQISMRSANE